jgi:DNA-binding NarL/FixJ family response regulator
MTAPARRPPRGGVDKWHDGVVRVLVAVESPLLGRRLSVVLGDEPDLEAMDEVADGDRLVARAVELGPDVVVVGSALPPRGAARSIAAVRAALPGVEAVVVGPAGDEELARAALSGAIGVLPTGTAVEHAAAAVRRVARRGPVLPLAVTARVIAEYEELARRSASSPSGHAPPVLAPAERAALLAVAADFPPAADDDPTDRARRAAAARNALARLTRHLRDEAVCRRAARVGAA